MDMESAAYRRGKYQGPMETVVERRMDVLVSSILSAFCLIAFILAVLGGRIGALG